MKLRKSYTYGSGKTNTEANITTDYLDGFHYEGSVLGKGDKPMVLKFLPTAEGYYDFENNAYIYYYKDHLGNIRLSYKNSGVGVEIVEEHHYYSFGLRYGTGGTYNTYKYQFQGQEQQEETGWYSFKWRNYDPSFGRFFGIDPLSEKYNIWAPYVLSGNRVVDARELEGLEPLVINKTTKNLIIVNQGWIGQSPPHGATQSINFEKFNRDGGIDYGGIGILNNLNSAENQVGVFASSRGNNTKKDILSSIRSFRKQNSNGKLIMVGHSLGADNLIELVNEHIDIKVDLLFTLDIADVWDDDNISPNVKSAVNYYNKRDGFMGSAIGGEDIEVQDSLKTQILNVPVSSSHTEIDNKYRYNVYNAVVKELNRKEKKDE